MRELLEKILVENYKIKFVTSEDGRFLENIILELILEDGQRFIMGGIPLEMANEIRKYLSKSDAYQSEDGKKLVLDMDDARYTIFDILLDFPDIEKTLYNSIKEIVINYYDPEYNIYGATIEFNDQYTIAKKKVLMIPSHAILLSLLANKKIYVSEKLILDQSHISEKRDDPSDFSDDDWDDDFFSE